MKKLFLLATVAVFSVILYTSCQKKTVSSDAHYCICAYKDVNGNDSGGGAYEGYGAIFSFDKAKIQCAKYEANLQKTKPTIECTLE